MGIDVTNKPLTLGRGQILLSKTSGVFTDTSSFRYVGNTPEFAINFEETTLDHYSSDFGIKEKDESVTLEVNRTGNFTTDRVSPSNLALFLLGSASALTQAALATQTETFAGAGVFLGAYLQVGKSASNIVGVRGITVTSVTDVGAVTTYTEGTDYRVIGQSGMIEVLESGTIVEGDDLVVNYDIEAQTRNRIISGNTPFDGALQYIEANPVGENRVILMPRVRLRANGDFALKTDEWQALPFSVEILKLPNYEAVYVDGEPYTP
jgi:hypothetical protein